MGNVVSKKRSTREILKNLDKMIIKAENNKKEIIKSQSSCIIRIYYFLIVFLILSILYAFLDSQSLILFTILPILVTGFLRFVMSVYYNWRLENILFNLEDLKDQQKEQIEILKSEDDYKDTMELLDKFEGSTLRNTSFSRVTQKKPNVLDTVTDIVLGEDPSNLYALICSQCHYHNGMIHPSDDLKEYVCYNCNTRNLRNKKTNKKNLNFY